jgi:hypothetical protein
MRKNRISLVITVILAVVVIILIVGRSKGTFKKELKDFAIDDSTSVTRIFMADKAGNSVDLQKIAPGHWTANKQYKARNDGIFLLLKTMMNMEILEPVAREGYNNVIKRLASSGVKVEIYQMVFRIKLFGIRLFPHEKLTRVYYVGSNTMDNQGTYMLLEGSSVPFITYLPGFRGFISVRFSPRIDDWRDHTIFAHSIRDIKSIKTEFNENPSSSFLLTNEDDRNFTLTSLVTGEKLMDMDTARLLDYLVAFNNIRFESIQNDLPHTYIDSVKASRPFHVITLEDKSGKKVVVKTYHRNNTGSGVDFNGAPLPYDPDHMDALVNEDKDFVGIQFFIFDNILKPLEYFRKSRN